MGFKEKNNDQINEDQIKLIETAQRRVKQKKNVVLSLFNNDFWKYNFSYS
jgi:hypothetical protein